MGLLELSPAPSHGSIVAIIEPYWPIGFCKLLTNFQSDTLLNTIFGISPTPSCGLIFSINEPYRIIGFFKLHTDFQSGTLLNTTFGIKPRPFLWVDRSHL